MAGDPDNITLHQLRHIRVELSDTKAKLGGISDRLSEMETRELASGKTRVRHEERLAEIEAAMERVQTRLGLRDDD